MVVNSPNICSKYVPGPFVLSVLVNKQYPPRMSSSNQGKIEGIFATRMNQQIYKIKVKGASKGQFLYDIPGSVDICIHSYALYWFVIIIDTNLLCIRI